jgi:hypothetical protein
MTLNGLPLAQTPVASTAPPPRTAGPNAPTEKQLGYYRLMGSPVFTEDERKRALD